jgi:hypothetical protein
VENEKTGKRGVLGDGKWEGIEAWEVKGTQGKSGNEGKMTDFRGMEVGGGMEEGSHRRW